MSTDYMHIWTIEITSAKISPFMFQATQKHPEWQCNFYSSYEGEGAWEALE